MISDRIDWLMKLRKKGGYNGFWTIRREAAEWGYELALADIQQLFYDELSEEEKKDSTIIRLYQKISSIK